MCEQNNDEPTAKEETAHMSKSPKEINFFNSIENQYESIDYSELYTSTTIRHQMVQFFKTNLPKHSLTLNSFFKLVFQTKMPKVMYLFSKKIYLDKPFHKLTQYSIMKYKKIYYVYVNFDKVLDDYKKAIQ